MIFYITIKSIFLISKSRFCNITNQPYFVVSPAQFCDSMNLILFKKQINSSSELLSNKLRFGGQL